MSLFQVSLTINMPNCHIIQVTHVGPVLLFSDLILEDVLFVSSLEFNLMFVHKFISLSVLYFSHKLDV